MIMAGDERSDFDDAECHEASPAVDYPLPRKLWALPPLD
jgi:hypothetical protein